MAGFSVGKPGFRFQCDLHRTAVESILPVQTSLGLILLPVQSDLGYIIFAIQLVSGTSHPVVK
jgi:hypothetical protein